MGILWRLIPVTIFQPYWNFFFVKYTGISTDNFIYFLLEVFHPEKDNWEPSSPYHTFRYLTFLSRQSLPQILQRKYSYLVFSFEVLVHGPEIISVVPLVTLNPSCFLFLEELKWGKLCLQPNSRGWAYFRKHRGHMLDLPVKCSLEQKDHLVEKTPKQTLTMFSFVSDNEEECDKGKTKYEVGVEYLGLTTCSIWLLESSQ